jgi:N-acetylneuraminic acid mutarotase
METGLSGHSAVYHDNKIVVFGGRNSDGKLVNKVLVYDISTA